MTGELANHLWQSTVFAGLAALLTIALRGNQARVRYWVWFSASLKFIVPFALLFSFGSRLEWPSVEPKPAAPSLTAPLLQIGAPFTTEAPLTMLPPKSVSTANRIDWSKTALLSAWALGFLTIVVMRYRAWRRIRLAIRASAPWHRGDLSIGPGLDIRASPGVMEPGIVGFWKPMLLVPVGIDEHLTRLQLQTVIVHEQCHANRRDNLTAAVHMLIEAVFWFHPAVWWIGARLVKERERACDEYVLRTTDDPQAYAEAILSICKRYVAGSLACVSGVSGADLRSRLEAIVANHVGRQLDTKRCMAVAMVAAASVTAPVIAGALNSRNVAVQSGEGSFESAAVQVSAPSTNPTVRGGALRGGRYEIRTATMVDLISIAYDIEPDKVLGGPNWLDWERFDVLAKAPQAATPRDLSLMLRKLLADRFELKVRMDTKLMPAFALSAGKGKPKMKAASGADQPACQNVPQNTAPGATVQYLVISCHNMTMGLFADVLRGVGGGTYLADPVVDQTRLAGAWDFDLKWTPRPRLAQAGADGITLFDAIEKQLGLKLEAQKAPLPVLRIESVNEKPTPDAPGVAATIPPAPLAEFEVASIKPSAPNAVGFNLRMQNGRMDLQNVTLKQLIQVAWDLSNNDDLIVGLPKSADADRFVVTAKVAVSGPGNVPNVDDDTLRLMLQGLLAERFRLKAHMEDRPVEAYTLTASKQTKLQKADPQNRTHCKAGAGTNPILNRGITCENMSMTQFAAALPNLARNYVLTPVKDATGLDGSWDFGLNFSAVNLLPGNRFDPNAASGSLEPTGAVTLQEALEKQLGLKLDREKRPLPILVVDHVEERPTEN